jgi:alcohol dehydrogenase, propanol-preferring
MDRTMTVTPVTMRAWRLLAWGAPPELVEVPVPVPRGTELLIRVDAAGLCHSDLHIMDAVLGVLPYELPFTLGHEVAGTVVATGDDAEAGWLGRRVAVHGVWSCGRCRQCHRGRENYCSALTGPVGGGIGRDGGLADYMLVPAARHLVPVDGIDPLTVAPLTDAGLTAQHALDTHRELLPGATVVVIGVGGLGHLALQLLAGHDPACVVAVEPRFVGRELAMKLGADAVVPAAADAAAWLDGCDGGNGADLVFDFVGTEETLASGSTLLAPGGRLVVVGSAGGRLEVGKSEGLERGWGVSAPFWGTRRDLAAVVRFAEAGRIRAEVETYRLGEVLTAYECLRAGRVQGRAVVVPEL